MENMIQPVTIGHEVKRTLLGFYDTKENGTTIRYPLSYGYKVFYILGSIAFVLSLIDLLTAGAIIGGASPGIVTLICIIGLLMEGAARKDLARKKPELHLAKYLKYQKNKEGETTIRQADQTDVLKTYILLIVIEMGLFIFLASTGDSTYTDTTAVTNDTYTTQQLITDTVRQTKADLSLPQQLDEATTLIDITAQPNAIRYHYVLSGVDTNQLSNTYLKNFLLSSICSNTDTATLLKQNINMEYSYSVSGTTKSYLVPISRTDCSF